MHVHVLCLSNNYLVSSWFKKKICICQKSHWTETNWTFNIQVKCMNWESKIKVITDETDIPCRYTGDWGPWWLLT